MNLKSNKKYGLVFLLLFVLATSSFAGYSKLIAKVQPSTVAVLLDGEVIGAGTVIGRERVLTCSHVVDFRGTYTITLADGREYPVSRIIFSGGQRDLAILITPTLPVKSLPLARSGSLKVGDMVLAFGSPYGFTESVSLGMVSHIDRDLENPPYVYFDMIQTDAPINPGNSGGVLVDEAGNLVGVVAAAVPEADGMGFAIPVSEIQKFLKEIK